MRAKVVTTVTSEVDIETFEPEVSVDIEDCDGLSDASPEVLAAVVVGAMRAVIRGLHEQYPRLARIDD